MGDSGKIDIFAIVKKVFPVVLIALAVLSCGTAGKRAKSLGPVQMPLEDPSEIARSQQRAREVMDSIDRLKAGTRPETTVTTSQKKEEKSAPKTLADQVIAYARSFTGTPYKLGASGPKQFDCSNFTSYVFKHFGYTITPFSQRQFQEGREVEGYSELQKGDLVFFGKRGKVRDIGHVGIVVSVDREKGSFTFIHASVSRGVTEDSSSTSYFMMRYMGARRILPDEKH